LIPSTLEALANLGNGEGSKRKSEKSSLAEHVCEYPSMVRCKDPGKQASRKERTQGIYVLNYIAQAFLHPLPLRQLPRINCITASYMSIHN
jgi:hypothetical protein